MNEMILTLQETLSHQAEDIARLSDELYTQQKDIARLTKRLNILAKELHARSDAGADPTGLADQPVKPPHY